MQDWLRTLSLEATKLMPETAYVLLTYLYHVICTFLEVLEKCLNLTFKI